MGSGPHRHTGSVDDGGHVVRMRALHLERDDRALLPRGTENAQRVDLAQTVVRVRSEEHTSELQSRSDLVCRLLLEKKKKNIIKIRHVYSSNLTCTEKLHSYVHLTSGPYATNASHYSSCHPCRHSCSQCTTRGASAQ